MKIAVGSDMQATVPQRVVEILQEMGHEVQPFGALVAPKGYVAQGGL